LKRHWPIATIVFHLLLGCVVAAAQDAESGGSEANEGPKPGATPQADFSSIYLMNHEGRLVPVVYNMTPEQFEEIYLRAQGLSNDSNTLKPLIQSLTAVGEEIVDAAGAARQASETGGQRDLKSSHVDLSVTLSIAVETEGWVRIPLGFGQAALRALPDEAGHRRHLVTIEGAEAGQSTSQGRRDYVLWLQGRGAGTTEKIVLNFSVPVSGMGRERRMVLSFPRVAVSEMKLTVPMAEAEAEVPSGATVTAKANGNKTDLVVSGLHGDFDLVWRNAGGSEAESSPTVTAWGSTITATVVDQRHVEFEANLNVRAHGGELTDFEVRLPAGARLAEDKTEEGYTVREVTRGKQETQEGRLVKVSFPKPLKDSESTIVTLWANSDGAAENGQFPLGGFEIPKATSQSGASQSGKVIVREQGEWDVRCEDDRGLESISPSEISEAPEEVVEAFSYYKQPFSLALRVFPKQTRVSVEPHYDLSVESGLARLDATLKYTVRGQKAYQLKFDLKGWDYDGIGPDHLVVPEAFKPDESGMLVVNLENGMTAGFELSLQAHREIAPDATSIEFPLPIPQATSLSSTTLAVLPADNIDLHEDIERTVGLVRQQEPLNYRGETDEAVFAAELSVREQEISVEISTEITVASSEAAVKETLIFDVKYEPANALPIRLPHELAETGVVEYFLDGERLAAVDMEQGPAAEFVARKIMLPAPRQGRFEVTARYTIPVRDLEPDMTVRCVVPLIVPEEAVFVRHRLSTILEEGIGCRVNPDGAWQQVRDELTGYDRTTVNEYAAETPETRIVVGVFEKDPDTSGSAEVHAAWIQTWMMKRQRRDRAVFRFVSDRRHFEVVLPEGADTKFLRVVMDGDEVEYTQPSEQHVRLSGEQASGSHVLELWYPFSESRPARGPMRFELPQVEDGVWVRRSYWQLVLPGSEHIVSAPPEHTTEYEWGWRGPWWGRVPLMEQADLERWVGAVRDTPVPIATSRYLFSRFGSVGSVELRTASRTSIVGGASAVALLIGLLLIYVPATRHPFFGLVLVIAVAAGAFIWPGAALLFAQASGMGLALSVLGAVLYRGVARRRRRTIRRDIPSSVFERGSTQAQFGSSEVELIRSTATDPDAAAVHAPEK
jgi:hypothetical protein